MNNLVSIFTKTKLKNKACPWLVDKFDDVCVFSSGLDFGYVGAGVVIVINRSLARHVYKKVYRVSKIAESLRAKEANIKSVINKRMESFEINKGHMIRSVLKHPFCKVVLDHLVVNDDLILEPDLVKSKVNVIIEGWTRKRHVANNISIDWHHQYQSLDYVFDKAFSGVICQIGFDEFFEVVSDLPDDKAAGLSGISNELWKHCDKSVLNMLLVILNLCLSVELWKDVLTNTHPIALIKTARKILFKILSDRISLTYSAFDILHGDNFSSPIFAIGLVVEDALEKNQELWLVLQNMRKAYNLVMTDFGLTNNYHVHDGLDQGKVFSLLLWQIFYDPLLCEVKCQKSVYGYKLNFHFISKNSRAESCAGCSSFFVAGTFVDDTIWVGNSQIVIPINSRVSNSSLTISNLPISITKKGESYRYLGIFFSIKSLSKSSLARAHLDVRFFTNLVLKKAVSDKQFLYLVSAVLYLIGLKLKSGLLLDFSSDTIHYSFFYGLKSFSQCQSEGKVASLISFANSGGILGCLFVQCWQPIHLLVFPARIHVNVSNNFLAGMVHILFDCKLPLGSFLVSSFQFHGGVPMSDKILLSLQQYGIWKRLDSHGPVSNWFNISVAFFVAPHFSLLALAGIGPLDIHGSDNFISVCDCLSWIDIDSLSVYMDSLVKNLGMIGCRAGAAGLMSSTLVELQTIALALEYMSVARSVHLFSDSQVALDAYGSVVSGNSKHFVCDVFYAVCQVRWEVRSGSRFLDDDLCSNVNWLCSSRVWHSDLHMATGFTSRLTADTQTYFMKTLHCWLSITVWKCIYNKCYPSILCLYCGKVKVSDHVFSCVVDDLACHQVLESCMSSWRVLSGLFLPSSDVLQLLLTCALNFPVSSALYKGFVFNGWLRETISVFYDPKVAGVRISDFVQSICLVFRNNIWLVYAKYCAFMKKNGLIPVDGLIPILVFGLVSGFLAGVIKLLGIAEAFGVCFGFCKFCSFFSGIGNPVSVNISV
ncbi:hypothetical protein G9A89_014494 [Geosiphon pyriformis]|nr:hypothetical protein G9A89_014494 [Geosiphon pyriformis]